MVSIVLAVIHAIFDYSRLQSPSHDQRHHKTRKSG